MNCHEPAPALYSSLMRIPHFFSFIIYLLAVIALKRKHSDSFQDFSKFLLWHTIGSFVSEMYISFLALPVSHSVYPLYTLNGFLMYLDVPGMIVMNIELMLIAHTSLSVVELLQYRLNASQIGKKTCDPMKFLVYLFRFNLVVIVFYLIASTPFAMERQNDYRSAFYSENPSAPAQFQCANTFFFPVSTDVQYQILLAFLCSFATNTLIVTVVAVILTPIRIRSMRAIVSKKTVDMQKMLYYSVLVQVFIHSALFLFPASSFLKYAMEKIQPEYTPQSIYILLSYHGTCSTLAMICFTRPLRQSITGIFSARRSKVSVVGLETKPHT